MSQTQTSRGEHNYVELPSMEQIVEIEKQQSNAKESLEISDDHVKCQGCGILQPIITDNTKLIDSNGSRRVHQLRATTAPNTPIIPNATNAVTSPIFIISLFRNIKCTL